MMVTSVVARADMLDLSAIGQQAIAKQVPIVLIFTAPYCKFCKILKEEVIEPMKLEAIARKPIFVYVDSEDNKKLIDFNGKPVSFDFLSHVYKIKVTPTVIFTNSGGYRLLEPIIGIAQVDFYTYNLEHSIKKAFKSMGKST